MTPNRCRFCSTPLSHVFVDLGETPLANSFVDPGNGDRPEPTFPLTVYVCAECFLVQLPEHERAEEIFDADYAYFSSFSDSWLEHCRRYAEMAIERFGLGPESRVVEVASNDGYLLRFFAERGVPVLGVEPAANVAEAAEERGIPTLVEFFGEESARRLAASGRQADLLIGNNVLAHVPEINDFVEGLAIALASEGAVTMEFPHLLRLMERNQFDTIYHEHYSYLSFGTVREIFAAHGLELFDVDELPTHGGSLRIYAQHAGGGPYTVEDTVDELLAREREAGLRQISTYAEFGESVRRTREELRRFVDELKRQGHSIAAYGAAAKGNTLLNYCGIGTEAIDYVVDRSPHKQGKLLPGTRIPVKAPEKIFETRPDYVLILPWNLKDEIVEQMAAVADWGGRFFVAIPAVEVVE
ncbi:MAG: class I SAM-dependent methyltransferase [Thermoanaerobaculia bacterium]|nr:class I SAM-dependent methyltransferase [Thermoanaerobaculia bacterium]